MDVFYLNQPASSLSEEDDVAASSSINTGFDSHVVSVSSSINIGCDSFASHDDNASFYWVPRVSTSVLPVLGTVYDNLDECIEMYRKYTLEADPKKNDRQVRSSNFRVCGCKARVVFDMVAHTSKYTLTTFDVEHNHELDRVEYKHLLLKLQMQTLVLWRLIFVYGFESDAQMLITRMEERQEFTKDFSFDYFVKDAELCGLFWADEVVKYKMVFVPFTAIDNHRRSVTVGSGLLKKETTEAYGWLLRAFKKAFVRPPNIVVTDQDGVMRLVVTAEFPESKHRLCMWHIMMDRLMMEFNHSQAHKWPFKMYHLRSSWVPAFFVDSPLCGLMRTTSRKRHMQIKLDHQSFDSFPALLTPLPIEEHAAKVYTRSLFIRVLKDYQYILRRWTKDLIPPNLRNKKNRYGEKNEAIEKLAMEASIILDSCVHMLRNNEPKLSVFVNKMKAIKSDLEAELPIVPTRTVSDFVQEFMGVKKPDKVKVKNPTGVRPKGREKQKRIKSGREISMKKSMKKSNKKKNGCGVCGSTAHNRRTCPRKNDVDVLYPAVVVPGGSDHVDGGLRDGASGSVSV
ncbi:RNA-directed DNA polymerase, eukaryota [Tanacetum coccineum]